MPFIMPYYAFYYAMSLKNGHDVVHKKNWGREAFNNMIRCDDRRSILPPDDKFLVFQ